MKLKQQIHGLYNSFGSRGQHFLSYAYSLFPLRWRKKKGFWNYLEFLRSSQWHNVDWHKEYQSHELQKLIKFSIATTKFYRQLFQEHDIYPAEIVHTEDLSRLPIIQKEVLSARLKEFLPADFPEQRLIIKSTSGSTGAPFKFFQDYFAVMREEAFAVRHWENAGMKLGEPSVFLRSYVPHNEHDTYYFDPVNNRHFFSAYHLDEKTFHFYCKKMLESRSRFIFGYPSSLEIFSDFLNSAKRSMHFEAAITGSEMLSLTARKKIEKALNTKVFDWYGLAEPTVTMGQCEKGSYHLFSEYGILELLDAKNNPITKDGELGRIVGTNFTNRALPLIRYDTGDLGVFVSGRCGCGRGLPVVVSSIQGRKDDLLIGANGQFLPSVNFYSLFAELGGQVSRFQLVQNGLSNFKLKLVRGPEFCEQSVKQILEELNLRIGGRPRVYVETVDKIIPSKAGKVRAVIRNCDNSGKSTREAHED